MSKPFKKALFICGSLNQTSQLYQIARYFGNCLCFFTPYYMGDWRDAFDDSLLKYTILGPRQRMRALDFLNRMGCRIDSKGRLQEYDFVFTCSDLIVQNNIRGKPIFLVQEGMTDPEGIRFWLAKHRLLPRYAAGSSATGLSDRFRLFFIASEGYRELFIRKGISAEKLRVTGVPNFDDFAANLKNDFPHSRYVMAVTSHLRECGEYENRKEFILRARKISDGRQLIFKLHPAENVARATAEIRRWAPEALIFSEGNTNHMVANCDVFITRQSSVVYAAMVLGKKVYSDLDPDNLERLLPMQNGGTSAVKIAEITRKYLKENEASSL